jgi:hypothetical protein
MRRRCRAWCQGRECLRLLPGLQGVKEWGYGSERLGTFNGTIDSNDPTTTGHAVLVVGFSNSGSRPPSECPAVPAQCHLVGRRARARVLVTDRGGHRAAARRWPLLGGEKLLGR